MATEANSKQAPQASIGGFFSIELCLGALAFVACSLLGPELRGPARVAVGCSLAAGLVALFAIHAGYDHGINGLLGGFAGGMLGRMLLLGAGFFASGAHAGTQAAALAFTFTFFALYLLTVGTEIAYVLTRQRSLKRAA